MDVTKRCDHMYVTDADKELEMCGLCGVTFGEWHDGNVSTYRDGVLAERTRILSWVEANRTYLEIDDKTGWYRDHFDSESLIDFVNKGKTE